MPRPLGWRVVVGLAATELRTTTAELGGSAYVVAVSGELDPSSSVSLAGELDTVLARGGTRVAVDLSAVSLVDSSTLELLITRSRTLSAGGGELVLVVDIPTLRLLQLTGLASHFRLERSLAEAIDRFSTEQRYVDA
jgi:anti-anti-sigma factor